MKAGPSIPLSDAHLVLTAGEPAITEEVEEDEDICMSARLLTARAAEEAISVVAPGSPSWSLQVNAPSHVVDTPLACMKPRQLDLESTSDDEELDADMCNGYEEVYSLASDNDEASDEELEEIAYVNMALNLAKRAVAKGSERHVTSEAAESAEGIEEIQESWDEAKPIEFIGEGTCCFSDEMAFNFASDVLNGAFEQASATWEAGSKSSCISSISKEQEEMEELRLQAQATLSMGLTTGKLEEALSKASYASAPADLPIEALRQKAREALLKTAADGSTLESEMEALKARARETLLKAATSQRALMADESETLRMRAKDTLAKAAQEGQLLTALQAASETSARELKAKLRSTLFKAAGDGRLTSTLQAVAPKKAVTTKHSKAVITKLVSEEERKALITKARESLQNAAAEKKLEDKAFVTEAVVTKHSKAAITKLMPDADRKALIAKLAQNKLEEQGLEELREKAKLTLQKAVEDGKLIPALQTALEARQMKDLKAKVKDTFAKAVEEGRLTATLKKLAPRSNSEFENTVLKVRQTLATAVEEGSLNDTIRDVMQKGQAPVVEVKDPFAALRNKVQSSLKQGLQTGKLTKLFSASTEKDNWEGLRSKVQGSLNEGIATDKLTAALKEAIKPKVEEKPAEAPILSSPSTSETGFKMPSTPTRSHRRIIGGVVRGPSLTELDLTLKMEASMPSPASVRRSSKSSTRKSKEAPKAFRLDLSDNTEDATRSRPSSLTRGYDTLGTQIYSMENSPSASSAPKLMLQHPKLEASERRVVSSMDRVSRPSSGSKTSARLHAASAMAMDLGLSEGSTSTSSTDLLAAFRQNCHNFTPKSLSLDQKMRPSASLPSLGGSAKLSKGRLLPTLAVEKKSAESIAWTMHMSKTTSKWCNTGLRHSSSMVF
jgi:hypothetical protein